MGIRRPFIISSSALIESSYTSLVFFIYSLDHYKNTKVPPMKRHHQTGLTLIELMVTLSVIAILATVAAPSLQNMIERNQLQTLTNNMVSNLYFARSEAAKRGFNISLCATNNTQTACDADATSFANGWIIFTDYDKNASLTPDTTKFDTNGDGLANEVEEILLIGEAPNERFALSSNGTPANSISYRPTGDTLPRAFSLTITKAIDNTALSRIFFNTTGRVRSCMIKAGDSSC